MKYPGFVSMQNYVGNTAGRRNRYVGPMTSYNPDKTFNEFLRRINTAPSGLRQPMNLPTPNPLSTTPTNISGPTTPVPNNQPRGMMDYWNQPVVGKVPLSQFVQTMGAIGGALSPNTPQGRVGMALSSLATPAVEAQQANVRQEPLIHLGGGKLYNPNTGQTFAPGGVEKRLSSSLTGISPTTGKLVYFYEDGTPSDVEVGKLPTTTTPPTPQWHVVKTPEGWGYQNLNDPNQRPILGAPAPSVEGTLTPRDYANTISRVEDDARQEAMLVARASGDLDPLTGAITGGPEVATRIQNNLLTIRQRKVKEAIDMGMLPKEFLSSIPSAPLTGTQPGQVGYGSNTPSFSATPTLGEKVVGMLDMGFRRQRGEVFGETQQRSPGLTGMGTETTPQRPTERPTNPGRYKDEKGIIWDWDGQTWRRAF